METVFLTRSAEETRALGARFAQMLPPRTLVSLSGDLGSGKTTFVQGLLASLGARGPYVSPTFVIMKEYALPKASPTGVRRVYHADAYRLEEKDVNLLGFSEWHTDPEGLLLLEWPERAGSLLPDNAVRISFLSNEGDEREIRVSGLG